MGFNIIEGQVARSDAWDHGYPDLATRFTQDDMLRPEWGASGIYGLMNVQTPDGKTHLVGTVSKSGYIYDFSTKKVVYDFMAGTGGSVNGVSGSFGLSGPISNGDTYDSATYWQSPVDRTNGEGGWYYFGGFITGPVQSGTSFSSLNKYTYLLRTRDLVNWQILVKDQSADASSWRAEIGGLVPTNNKLYILRADLSGAGDQHAGLYSYDGTAPTAGVFTINRDTTEQAHKGVVFNDYFMYSVRQSQSRKNINLITAATGSDSLASVSSITGGTYGADFVYQGSYGKVGGNLVTATQNGYMWSRVNGTTIFVPLCIYSVDGFGRALGWRAGALEVAGGLVIPANAADPSDYIANVGGKLHTNPQSYLLWIGPGGQTKVLDVGGHFSGLAVHGDRLYYGVTEHPSANRYSNYLFGAPALASIHISEIKTRKVPFSMNVLFDGTGKYSATASGVNGLLGGIPTLGYTGGKMRIYCDTSVTLTFSTWTSELYMRDVGTVSITANTAQIIDLAPYLDGNLLGFRLSANATIEGSVTLT
ncbi:hypothetical protein [Arthrobacter sp. NA-172]|uniref:hypothetical protein n=1 Tax=Arthrobacter sp. NA-172 TaxID=3367524 RepID=UPI003754D6F9